MNVRDSPPGKLTPVNTSINLTLQSYDQNTFVQHIFPIKFRT